MVLLTATEPQAACLLLHLVQGRLEDEPLVTTHPVTTPAELLGRGLPDKIPIFKAIQAARVPIPHIQVRIIR